MALTARQENFAQAIANGRTQSDAYRSSYSAGVKTDKSVWELSSTLAKNVKVASRVTELKTAIEAKGLWTREKSVKALAKIADDAEAKAAEITAAIKELNLMHGFNAPLKIHLGGTLIHRVELAPMCDNSKN